jgi:hypothetical protein
VLEVSFLNPEKGRSRGGGVQRQSERDGGKERLHLSKSSEIDSDLVLECTVVRVRVLNAIFCGLRPSCNFLKVALHFGNRLFFRPSAKKRLNWWTP